MERIVLKNKPLVEAIFDLRWELQESTPEIRTDPHYQILIGRVYDRVKNEYPFHEKLPAANMPDYAVGYIVQHRFRKGENDWPLIQIGPGLITLNDTENYVWDNFRKRSCDLLDVILEVYPEPENLNVNRLLLRYIDAVEFDYEKGDIFSFLKEKLKMNIKVHEKLFEDTQVDNLPPQLDLRMSFSCTKPNGIIMLRFVRGRRKEADALVWETIVESIGDDAPKNKDEITRWIDEAHELTHDWFFKMIEGDLRRRFE